MTQLEVAHAKAGLDLIQGAGLDLYDGKLPDNVTALSLPWVTAHAVVEWEHDTPNGSIRNESSSCVTTWYLRCAAANTTALMAVLGRIRAVLLDVVPVIAGRVCFPIRMVSVQTPDQDNTLGTAVIEATAIYELETRPA